MAQPLRIPAALALILLAAGCGGAPERPAAAPRRDEAVRHAVQPARGGSAQYVVQRGDTLYSIAFRNQIDYHDLASWNDIGRNYAIYPGRVLRLTPPGSATARAPPPAPFTRPAPRALAPDRPIAPGAAASAALPPAVSASAEPAPPAGDGHWLWPTRGSVVRRFAVDGCKGVDLAGETGQMVVAAAGGKIVYSGSALKGYGELVIVKHDEQYLSAYGYNRRLLVEEGQQVQAGQPIAEMGLGPEQRPILHFEIRDKGRPIDPLPLLPRQ